MGKILENRPLARGYYRMSFEADFAEARPGQFVMLRVGLTHDPLLRRPMSVAGFENGVCTVIYRSVGKGTAILAEIREGETVNALGPLGNWFDPPSDAKKILLVGGGIGVAPLRFWHRRNGGKNAVAYIGGATKEDILCKEEFAQTVITTIDGSAGTRGLITAPLVSALEGAYVLACGPKGMLKAVDDLCKEYGATGELSLEERMGCGFGVCLGCVVDTAAGKKRLCVDGPVFKTGSVQWQF